MEIIQKIQAKQESGLTTVWLKQDPPVYSNAIWCNSGRRSLSVQPWQCFGKTRQVIVIPDDTMIVGKKTNHSNHDQALTTSLDTARRCNVQLNYEKLQYKKSFFGEIYTTSSHKPDMNKVTANTKMSAPQNKKEVQSFIGMINYLSKFSARLPRDCRAHQRIGKGQGTFQLGHRRDCKCSHIGLLQS